MSDCWVPSDAPTFDLTNPVDPRGGMQSSPDFSIIAMQDGGAVRDGNDGSLTIRRYMDDK
jgi:hypothetical protein